MMFSPSPFIYRRLLRVPCAMILAFVLLNASPAPAAETYDAEPIGYATIPATDAVARLQRQIDAGDVTLTHEPKSGYLVSLLAQLKVPVSSQTLVFSKTSLQRGRISPRTPRAIYFNDDVYVGFVRGGDLEIAAADPRIGTTFYTLEQDAAVKPKLVRKTDSCLQCHGGSMTRDMPGLLLRSVFPDARGLPVLRAGSSLVTQETPFEKRWGGWYVTGTHGQQRHLGNTLVTDEVDPDALDTSAGANVTNLSGKFDFDASAYLSGHSDVVALMVMEHQVQMHNLIGRANYQTRLALHDERVMNTAFDRPADFRSDGTQSRLRGAAEPLVKYMLFCGEAKLTDRVQGTSGFAAEYASQGPRDGQGRSLRALDLERRLLKHPCSPLIYSPAFDGLPETAREYIFGRLFDVLSGKDQSTDFAHLAPGVRRAILEILRETKPGLPGYWKGA